MLARSPSPGWALVCGGGGILEILQKDQPWEGGGGAWETCCRQASDSPKSKGGSARHSLGSALTNRVTLWCCPATPSLLGPTALSTLDSTSAEGRGWPCRLQGGKDPGRGAQAHRCLQGRLPGRGAFDSGGALQRLCSLGNHCPRGRQEHLVPFYLFLCFVSLLVIPGGAQKLLLSA